MSIQTVEISLPESIIKVVEIRQGPAGPAGGGTNSVTSATTSDGTAALYLDSIRFEATNGGPTQLGEMAWESTDGSIDAMLESGVIVAMGEDLVIRVRNTTASPITKGTALAYDGTSGASGRIEVKPWVGANIPTSKLFLGFAACDMPANSNGYSQWFGKLTEINTSGGAQTWLDEQIIYAVPGASATLTNIAPTSGEYAAAAVVINAGNGTSGILFVRPTLEVASSTSATANALVLRDGSGGASLAALTLPGTSGSSFTSTLTGGFNFANRTLVLPDVSGTLVTADTLANSATITASTAVAVNTIVLRDSAGVINISNANVTGTTAYASTAGWTYAGSSASAHRIALGAGTTGAALFGAATAEAARTTLELGAFATNGSITGTGALTFTSASASNINLTPGTTGFIDIAKASATGVRESILRAKVSDAGDDAFHVFNGTSLDGRFTPGFSGSAFSASAQRALQFVAQTNSSNDTGTTPLMSFEARRTTSTTDPNNGTLSDIVTRPLFEWRNVTGSLATMAPSGALSLLATTSSTTTTTGALVVSGGVGIAGNINAGGSIAATGTVRTGGYTFATLPTPTQGMRTFITDGAALPIYMANAAGGSNVVTPVFYNGTNWINA
jgi:hypothetical protein